MQPGESDAAPFERSVEFAGDVAVAAADALQQDEGLTFEATATFDPAAGLGALALLRRRRP